MPEIIGRYQILRELGQGGMGVVYLAYDPHLERQVVVKKIIYQPFDKNQHQETLRRFQQEAKAIARLDHPAIIPVYDFGIHNGQPYLVMKYVSGGSLADRLRHEPLALHEISRILHIIGPAIDYIHQQQIIHRDLKPANILFDDKNNPYIADFGLVKSLTDASGHQTSTHMIVGTPAYMSPEQVKAKEELDGLSDIYSLGVIFYQMLAGKLPYEANSSMGTALMHLNEPIPQIRMVRKGLPYTTQKTIDQVLAKAKTERYPSALALALAVDELAEQSNKKGVRRNLFTHSTVNMLTGLGVGGVVLLALVGCLLVAFAVLRNNPISPTPSITPAVSNPLPMGTPSVTVTSMPTATLTATAIPTDIPSQTPGPMLTKTRFVVTPTIAPTFPPTPTRGRTTITPTQVSPTVTTTSPTSASSSPANPTSTISPPTSAPPEPTATSPAPTTPPTNVPTTWTPIPPTSTIPRPTRTPTLVPTRTATPNP